MRYLNTLSDKELLDKLFKVGLDDYTIEEISSVKRIIWNRLQRNNSHVEIANQLKSSQGRLNITTLEYTFSIVPAGLLRTFAFIPRDQSRGHVRFFSIGLSRP